MDVDVSSDESDEDMPGPGFGLPGIGMGIQPAGHPGGQQGKAEHLVEWDLSTILITLVIESGNIYFASKVG